MFVVEFSRHVEPTSSLFFVLVLSSAAVPREPFCELVRRANADDVDATAEIVSSNESADAP